MSAFHSGGPTRARNGIGNISSACWHRIATYEGLVLLVFLVLLVSLVFCIPGGHSVGLSFLVLLAQPCAPVSPFFARLSEILAFAVLHATEDGETASQGAYTGCL